MATIEELEQQVSQGESQLLNRTSPLAFSQILRNALKGRLGGKSEELERSREASRTELGQARQSLTAGLSPGELRNMNPAQQRELVQGRRSGLEASISRTQEESQRIEGSAAEQIEQGRLMQEDIQNNMITRLNFLKDDLSNQKTKQAEFKNLAFGLAATGVAVTPEIDEMLKSLTTDERALWLSQNTTSTQRREEDLALQRASLGGTSKGFSAVEIDGQVYSFNQDTGELQLKKGGGGDGDVLSMDATINQMEQAAGQSFSQARRDEIISEMRSQGSAELEKNSLHALISELGTGGERDGAFGAIASFQNAKDIVELIQSGVKTGPLAGKILTGIDVFGVPITPGQQTFDASSPEQNQLLAAMTAFSANYIKGISGVAVSEKEYNRLVKALPTIDRQEGVNIDSLVALMNTLKNLYETKLNISFDDYPTYLPEVGQISARQDLQSFVIDN